MSTTTFDAMVSSARYYIGSGVVLATDFMKKAVSAEQMKSIDTTGMMVWNVAKPVPCMFFAFGVAGAFLSDMPCSKIRHVTRTDAEQAAMSDFVMTVDPHNRYGIRICQYMIDIRDSGAILARKPTDEEIATMSMRYKDRHRTVAKRKEQKKRRKNKDPRDVAKDDIRMKHELCAIDRRRYVDCGAVPPESRAENLKRIIASAKRGEPDLSDTDEDEPSTLPVAAASIAMVYPEKKHGEAAPLRPQKQPPPQRHVMRATHTGLFGSSDEEKDDGKEAVERDKYEEEEATTIVAETDPFASAADPSAVGMACARAFSQTPQILSQKRARKNSSQRDFDAALRSLRGRRQTRCQSSMGSGSLMSTSQFPSEAGDD